MPSGLPGSSARIPASLRSVRVDTTTVEEIVATYSRPPSAFTARALTGAALGSLTLRVLTTETVLLP
jgi:hypothetical protein